MLNFKDSEVLRKRKSRLKRNDARPICNCSSYNFPHKIGGKCKGQSFAEFYFYNDRNLCCQCNCLNENNCDVAVGKESIEYAECYIERKENYPSEYLPLDFIFIEED